MSLRAASTPERWKGPHVRDGAVAADVALPGPVAPRFEPYADTSVYPYPLRSLNGSAMLRRPSDHTTLIRLNVDSSDTATVAHGLAELTDVLRDFLAGFGRRRHTSDDAQDLREWRQLAFVGFGAPFFRDRDTGQPRFTLAAIPRAIDYLNLRGDREHGLDAHVSQPDMLVQLESEDHSLVVDGTRAVLAYARRSGWLRAVDVQDGASRGDARDHLGFLDGIHNPGPDSDPRASDVVFVGAQQDRPAFDSGSYLCYRKYRLDLEAWKRLKLSEQEAAVGEARADGAMPAKSPQTAHAWRASTPGAPLVYRRGTSYVDISPTGDVESGLLFLSFQRDVRQLVSLHDDVLLNSEHPDALLTSPAVQPLTADLYFIPDHISWEWGYVGQQFFEPELFERLIEGNTFYFDWEPERALEVYRKLVADYPDFLLGYANLAILCTELGEAQEAERAAAKALELHPNHYLANNDYAWTMYLQGRYEEATYYARRTIALLDSDDYRLFPYHTLGAALVQLRRLTEAEQALMRAAARPPTEPLVFFSLGTCYEEQGRQEDAVEAYRRTIEIVRYRARAGAVSARENRALFNLSFIHYHSERSVRVLRDARAILVEAGSPNLGQHRATAQPTPEGE